MSIFFTYVLLGISLAAPIGPVNAAQLDNGIRYGFKSSWLTGFSAMMADAVYMLMIYLGLSQLVDTPLLKTFLWAFGFFILCYTGVETILKAGSITSPDYIRDGTNKSKAFRTGFFIAISNPLNIMFWLGIYGSILAKTASTQEGAHVILYSMGIFVGIILWDTVVAGAAAGSRRALQPSVLRIVSILSGFVLIGFGIYFGYQAAMALFL
ncbi:LysE family transporter [Thalassobacillus hwangdonensis]|uniref:LysE family transporter n=1 Tax=Thalassobacillus hwangdonensis TaxID=546108 RepID=A0ABW3L0X9_9BACI